MPEVGIIGAGTMGHGIAQCFAVKGWQVRLYDVNREVLDSAPARIRANLELFRKWAGYNRKPWKQPSRILLLGEDLPCDCPGPGLIIETVSEDLDLKRRLFAELEALIGPRSSSAPTPRP